MTQLALAFPPATPRIDDRVPTFMAEVAKLLELARSEVRLLRGHLVDASNAFDDCTGEYPQELVSGEGWREAAFELGAGE